MLLKSENRYRKAVSFAELILVLAIIGVVAALTIPGMKKHSQRAEMGQLAKKAYMTIEDAMDNAVLSEGPMRNWNLSSNKVFFERYLSPNIKSTQRVNDGSCSDGACYIVTFDGMKMAVSECNGNFCHVHVDVNNDKSPNLGGKDTFEFQITKGGNDFYYKPESVQPHYSGVERLLRQNNWQFTNNLWNCPTAGSYNGSCGL